jgi:hypothetical protein
MIIHLKNHTAIITIPDSIRGKLTVVGGVMTDSNAPAMIRTVPMIGSMIISFPNYQR